MSDVRGYLLSIVAASFLVSLVSVFPQKKTFQRVIVLCGGLFILVTLLRPIISFRFGDLRKYLDRYEVDESLISDALEESQNESARLITEQTEEYILDKAAELGMTLSVEVSLATLTGSYQYPYSVTLEGSCTQEQRTALAVYISQTLGIPEERQIWNADN